MGAENQTTAKMIFNKDHQVMNYVYGTKRKPVSKLWSESIFNFNFNVGEVMFTSTWR
jgi:hypothetical protein